MRVYIMADNVINSVIGDFLKINLIRFVCTGEDALHLMTDIWSRQNAHLAFYIG